MPKNKKIIKAWAARTQDWKQPIIAVTTKKFDEMQAELEDLVPVEIHLPKKKTK